MCIFKLWIDSVFLPSTNSVKFVLKNSSEQNFVHRAYITVNISI